MLKRRPKSTIPERKAPGDPEPESCSPGSIEQQLDMCEEGELRGDAVQRNLKVADEGNQDPTPVDEEFGSFNMDMSEADREGDEMSGDEHSGGLQGEEPEEEDQRKKEKQGGAQGGAQ